MKHVIYTIGHSNLDLKQFIDLLILNEIELLIDVRSSPYSKYVPHFNSHRLSKSLITVGINYRYLGDKIGGKPSSDEFYLDGKVIYPLIRTTEKYKKGIIELIKFSKEYKTVIMCAEKNPNNCHRYLLIIPSLVEKGLEVIHIYESGIINDENKEDVQKTLFDYFK
jgi:uncharacterized protein (DUF488 family)